MPNRSALYAARTTPGRAALGEKLLTTFATCPIPEGARLGGTLDTWWEAFLGYFTTCAADNGGTEAINGLIEVHRRIARAFRKHDKYRLRMLLIGGGLTQVGRASSVAQHI